MFIDAPTATLCVQVHDRILPLKAALLGDLRRNPDKN